MSKTVSFVARDDLAEWLESRADEEMKTVSSVVQDIVAKEYRRQQSAQAGEKQQSEQGDALDRHPDAWYKPSSQKHDYAVRHPTEDERKYYKTREGAASRIEDWYEGKDTDARMG